MQKLCLAGKRSPRTRVYASAAVVQTTVKAARAVRYLATLRSCGKHAAHWPVVRDCTYIPFALLEPLRAVGNRQFNEVTKLPF